MFPHSTMTGRPRNPRSERASAREGGGTQTVDVQKADVGRPDGLEAVESTDLDTGSDLDSLDLQAEALQGELVEGDVSDFADVDVKLRAPAARTRNALATQDPLQQYMREVQRYSLLSAEETHAAAVDYVTTGNVDAAKKLVTANLRLVVKIAFDYKRAHRNVLDLIQEGNIGLMQAVRKYDPYRGVKLSSYAAWWIRAYMLRFILNNWRLVKLGTTQTQRKLFFNLKKEKARLAALGIDATPAMVAQRLDVPEEEVVQMDRRLASNDVSFDAPVSNESGSASRLDMYADDAENHDDMLGELESHAILSDRIHAFGKSLTGKDATIFYERLVADDPKTLQELGEQFGVSRERVRQIEKRLQNKIRAFLEKNVSAELLPKPSERPVAHALPSGETAFDTVADAVEAESVVEGASTVEIADD